MWFWRLIVKQLKESILKCNFFPTNRWLYHWFHSTQEAFPWVPTVFIHSPSQFRKCLATMFHCNKYFSHAYIQNCNRTLSPRFFRFEWFSFLLTWFLKWKQNRILTLIYSVTWIIQTLDLVSCRVKENAQNAIFCVWLAQCSVFNWGITYWVVCLLCVDNCKRAGICMLFLLLLVFIVTQCELSWPNNTKRRNVYYDGIIQHRRMKQKLVQTFSTLVCSKENERWKERQNIWSLGIGFWASIRCTHTHMSVYGAHSSEAHTRTTSHN